MSAHREWIDAKAMAVYVYPPDHPDHPDDYTDLPFDTIRRWAVEFSDGSDCVVIDGDPQDISDLLSRAQELLRKTIEQAHR